ncbi:pyridoxal-phosphate-dependent aminotransferase family protein [Flavobacterium degerlachei]|uniref:Alanine-glyoxylate transaminase / serine-glyoxylate transaminase / serine-pyruvate transaminase n=1 Tax=Flavobacterium degerlachei TaxID=229203 RepID=A0A1H2UCE9_9FLAO|nr:alanine--glyoxylate aminotransferase family protein [Flavobacterium degerlachei]SDW53873.1 alanine-glyoxylate transaminase / serine-glyoxylate transaminase / serine-pyruvate transaminase [Flavobacterium degerlachei]
MKARKLLMIPGPIEFEPAVLQAMGMATTSHVAPNFIEIFGNSLELMREVWKSPKGQPFIVAGTGTLGMDMAAANLIEAGDNVLVISSGYFGKRFKDILDRYGANTTLLEAPVGEVVSHDTIENELKTKQYKALTITHVDTSTGIIVDPKPIALLAKKYNTLSIVDGVCSVAGEALHQDEWGLDVVLTASQKAIGVPPGLALLMVSEKAMQVWKNRKTPIPNYYSDWTNWLPIMRAYEERKPSYFGTPAVNLIVALQTSLKIICTEGMEQRVKRHQSFATAFRAALVSINLTILPKTDTIAANTLTAVYYPEGIDGAAMNTKMSVSNVIIAGGLLPDIKASYFRIGHMGSVSANDLLAVLGALERALSELGHSFEIGKSLQTFQMEILKTNYYAIQT